MIVTTDPPRVVKQTPLPASKLPEAVNDSLCTGAALVLGDLCAVAAALVTAAVLIPTGVELAASAAIATTVILVFALSGLYPGVGLHSAWEFRKIVSAMTVAFAPFILLAALSASLPLGAMVVVLGLALVALPLSRFVTRQLCARTGWWGCRVVVFENPHSATLLYETLKNDPRRGLRPVASVDPSELAETDLTALPKADRAVVVLTGDRSEPDRSLVMAHLESRFRDITFLVPLFSAVTGEIWGEMQSYGGLSGVNFSNNLARPLPRAIKRTIDIVLSLLLLIALLPALALITLLVAFNSRGSFIYGHERIGKHGRRFRAWKFRTMVADADIGLGAYLAKYPGLAEQWRTNQKLEDDPRVTRLGRFLRKWSLDELPQLWNVLVGEMSLVGPRPIVLDEIGRYAETFDRYLMVTPGITGLWQVSGRNNTTYPERVAIDDFYVRNWSPWLDAYVMFRTVRTVVTADGAS